MVRPQHNNEQAASLVGHGGEMDKKYPANRQGHKHLYVCGSTYTLKGDGLTTCGKVIVSNEEHEVTGTYYGDPNATTHAISNRCGKCFGVFLATKPESGREPHEPSGKPFYYPFDNVTHVLSNYCFKCDATYYVGTSNHVFNTAFKEYEYLNDVSHAVSNTCRWCDMKVLVKGCDDTGMMLGSTRLGYSKKLIRDPRVRLFVIGFFTTLALTLLSALVGFALARALREVGVRLPGAFQRALAFVLDVIRLLPPPVVILLVGSAILTSADGWWLAVGAFAFWFAASG